MIARIREWRKMRILLRALRRIDRAHERAQRMADQ